MTADYTISGKEIHQLETVKNDPCTEPIKNAFFVLDKAGTAGRYKTGKVSLSNVIETVSKEFNFNNNVITRDYGLFYTTFAKAGVVNSGDIFGSFETFIDYEVIGINVYTEEPPNGLNPRNNVSVRVYDYKNKTGIGEVAKVRTNEEKTFKVISTPIKIFHDQKYGVVIENSESFADVKDINVQFVLRISNEQTANSLVSSAQTDTTIDKVNQLKETFCIANEFETGDVIRKTFLGNWVLARNCTPEESEAYGVVETRSAFEFTVVYFGKLNYDKHGFTIGNTLYLGDEGSVTTDPPRYVGTVLKPVGMVLNEDYFLISLFQGHQIKEEHNINDLLPEQEGNKNLFLQTDGCGAGWRQVSAEGIENRTITTEKLVDDSITNEKIVNDSITTEKIVNDSITTEKIKNNTIKTEQIKTDAIITEKIVNGAITNEKIASNTITPAKIDISALENVLNLLPDQNNQGGKYLQTDGTNAFWSEFNAEETIVEETITNELIRNNTLTGDKIRNNTITSNEIRSNTITSQQININELENALNINDLLPDQNGKDGRFLTTDGTNASWGEFDVTTVIQDNTVSGDKIQNNTITSQQIDINELENALNLDEVLPDQNGNGGRFLTTDGFSSSWGKINAGTSISDGSISVNKLEDDSITTDKLNVNEITEELDIREELTSTITRNVGPGALFYATLNEAIRDIVARYRPKSYDENGNYPRIILQMQSDYVMEEEVSVTDQNLSWITITTDGSFTTPTIVDRSFITTAAFLADNAVLPNINHQFEMNTNGTANNQFGIWVRNNSVVNIGNNSGFKNAAGENLRVARNSNATVGINSDFSGSVNDIGIRLIHQSQIVLNDNCAANNCAVHGLSLQENSSARVGNNSTFNNNGDNGCVVADGAAVIFNSGCSFNDNGGDGLGIDKSSSASCGDGCSFDNNATEGVLVDNSSYFGAANFTCNQNGRGVLCRNGSNIEISDITASNNINSDGLRIQTTSSAFIRGFKCNNNAGTGIFMSGVSYLNASNGNVITNSEANNNGNHGIANEDNSTTVFSRAINLTLKENGKFGIVFGDHSSSDTEVDPPGSLLIKDNEDGDPNAANPIQIGVSRGSFADLRNAVDGSGNFPKSNIAPNTISADNSYINS